jgi:hypothetical protein
VISFHHVLPPTSVKFAIAMGNLLVDMSSSKSQQRATATNVVEIVVGISHAQVASVLGGIFVRMTNQRALGLTRRHQ